MNPGRLPWANRSKCLVLFVALGFVGILRLGLLKLCPLSMYAANRSCSFELDGHINWDDTRHQRTLGAEFLMNLSVT